MENSWSLFSSSSPGGTRGHCSNLAWDIWDLGSLHSLHASTITSATATLPPEGTTITVNYSEESTALQAFMLNHHHQQQLQQQGTAASLYDGAASGTHYLPEPHLMCLKLGKRHYFEDATVLGERHVDDVISIAKRGRSPYHGYGGDNGGIHVGPPTSAVASATVASTTTVPKCQVEGCHVALREAKDYHRRHKVCEMHAKAPKVVVLGLDQRFCQQCSRFHAVTEFDEAKRSCRRRLAGHNERRRKGSTHDSINPKYTSQGSALSLLSSKNNTWFSSADLSSRCSAALRELIAENRAAIMAQQLISDHSTQPGSNFLLTPHHQMLHDPHNWDCAMDM